METPESTLPRGSKRRCLRRDKEPAVCTPQNEPSPSSYYSGSFSSPARHAADDADMATQQLTLMQSLRDANQGSRALANVLQEATDIALQSSDRQAELVALAQNALKVMKNTSSGHNEKATAEGTNSSSFSQASSAPHHDRLVELLRQRNALSTGREVRQGSGLYAEDDTEKSQASSLRKGQTIDAADFLRLRGEVSHPGTWTPPAKGVSQYETPQKERTLENTNNTSHSEETRSQPPSDPRDVLHLAARLQTARSCGSPSLERGPLRPRCITAGLDMSAPSTPYHSVGNAPRLRTEASIASCPPVHSSSPEPSPGELRAEPTPRSPPSPDMILQTLRALVSLTAPSTASVAPCNLPVAAGPGERDPPAASIESLGALLRNNTAPATAVASSSTAGVCFAPCADPSKDRQRAGAPADSFSGAINPAAQNLLYTLLMSCGTGHNRRVYPEREGGTNAGSNSGRVAEIRDDRQCRTSPNHQGALLLTQSCVLPAAQTVASSTRGLLTQSCVLPAAQTVASSTPLHVLSSPDSGVERAAEFENSSSSAEYKPGTCAAARSFGKPSDESSKEAKALSRGGMNCCMPGLFPKKTQSLDLCRSSSDDSAQMTPTHSTNSSLRRRGSLLISAEKEVSSGARGALGEGTGLSRGRSRAESLARGDSMSKLDPLTRSENTARSGNGGRTRGRYTGVSAGGEALTLGSLGRGGSAIIGGGGAAGGVGSTQESETGKPDVTLGGNRPHYHVAKQEWRVRYYLNGKRKMRTYSAKFYGYEAAHSMATDFAHYVDKNEALPHPACKPVGLGGGRAAAALSIMANRAPASAAAAATERSDHPETSVSARYATKRQESPAQQQQQQPDPVLVWDTSPAAAAAAKHFEALRLACAGAASKTTGSSVPQPTHNTRSAGTGEIFPAESEASAAVPRLAAHPGGSTRVFQRRKTPTHEESSPFYEHSLSSTTVPDRESASSSRTHEMQEDSDPLPNHNSRLHEQQTTPPAGSFSAADFPADMTLANFLKGRKRRNPGVSGVEGGPSTPPPPPGPAAAVPPATNEGEEGAKDGTMEERQVRKTSCTQLETPVVHGLTERHHEGGGMGALRNTAAGTNAGAETFLEGLPEKEKAYLSKLFTSVLMPPVASQQPPDTAATRQADGSTRTTVRGATASVAPAALRLEERPSATESAQDRCALLLHNVETRSSFPPASSVSISSPAENGSTCASRSNSYKALTEAGASSQKAYGGNLAAELLPRHVEGKATSLQGASVDADRLAEETRSRMDNTNSYNRDNRGLSTWCAGLTGGGGRAEKEAGVARTPPTAAVEVIGQGVLARTLLPMSAGSAGESESERIVSLAPGHATAAMLAKTAMSQQMLDTVMLFDEFIRGFEKEFSAEQLQQQRRAILAPAACLGPEGSAGLPSLTSSHLGSGNNLKSRETCGEAAGANFSFRAEGDAQTCTSQAFANFSNVRNVKDSAWLPREGPSTGEASKHSDSALGSTDASFTTLLTFPRTSAIVSAAHEGVHRVVTGFRLQLGSSELLVLSRVLVELTSSTYVLVTTLRATLASSTDIVQKHCDTRATPDATRSLSQLSRDTVRPSEDRDLKDLPERSRILDRSGEVQRQVACVAPKAGAADRLAKGSQQQHSNGETQQHEQFDRVARNAEKSAAAVITMCSDNAARGKDGPSEGEDVRIAVTGQNPRAGNTFAERRADKETPASERQRAREEESAANDTCPDAAPPSDESQETADETSREAQFSTTSSTADSRREKMGPHEGVSASLVSSEESAEERRSQAVEKLGTVGDRLQTCGASSSPLTTLADSACGESDGKENITQGGSGSPASEVHNSDRNGNDEMSRGGGLDQTADQQPTRFASYNVQPKHANVAEAFPEQERREGGQWPHCRVDEVAQRQVGRAADGLPPQQARQSFAAANKEAAGEEESMSTISDVAPGRQLGQKTTRSPHTQQRQQCEEGLSRLDQHIRLQADIRAENPLGLSLRKDVVGCSCTDGTAVLDNIVTLLQSQQRLVTVVRQLQASLPQYLRLIIRVAGHCFLPYKLPPATYFISHAGPSTRNSGQDAAAGRTSASAAAAADTPAAAASAVLSGQPGGAEQSRAAKEMAAHSSYEGPVRKQPRCGSSGPKHVSSKSASGGIAGGQKLDFISLARDEDQAQRGKPTSSELQQQESDGSSSSDVTEKFLSSGILSRQSSVTGFHACGAASSAASTEVECNSDDSPGLAGGEADRKVSSEEDETSAAMSPASHESQHGVNIRIEASGGKQSEHPQDGRGRNAPTRVQLAGAAAASSSSYSSSSPQSHEEGGTHISPRAGNRRHSLKSSSSAAGRASAVPYVEVPGGRLIQDEAGLEVFLLRPFHASACDCQDKPCPCDRQHIADLIHMLYTLPTTACEELETHHHHPQCSPPFGAASDCGTSSSSSSRVSHEPGGNKEAELPAFNNKKGAATLLQNKSAEARQTQQQEREETRTRGDTQEYSSCCTASGITAPVLPLNGLSAGGRGPDHVSSSTLAAQQEGPHHSRNSVAGVSSAHAQEMHIRQNSSSSSSSTSAYSKLPNGLASSRTTSSGSSSSSSDPSIIGSDALLLVESLRQVLFSEKVAAESNSNGCSVSSTFAAHSASTSPFSGSQTTGTPHTLLSAAGTPGSASSSCAGSPFQRGLNAAAATAASSLLREATASSSPLQEAARQPSRITTSAAAAAAIVKEKEEEEEKLSGCGREGKATPEKGEAAASPRALEDDEGGGRSATGPLGEHEKQGKAPTTNPPSSPSFPATAENQSFGDPATASFAAGCATIRKAADSSSVSNADSTANYFSTNASPSALLETHCSHGEIVAEKEEKAAARTEAADSSFSARPGEAEKQIQKNNAEGVSANSTTQTVDDLPRRETGPSGAEGKDFPGEEEVIAAAPSVTGTADGASAAANCTPAKTNAAAAVPQSANEDDKGREEQPRSPKPCEEASVKTKRTSRGGEEAPGQALVVSRPSRGTRPAQMPITDKKTAAIAASEETLHSAVSSEIKQSTSMREKDSDVFVVLGIDGEVGTCANTATTAAAAGQAGAAGQLAAAAAATGEEEPQRGTREEPDNYQAIDEREGKKELQRSLRSAAASETEISHSPLTAGETVQKTGMLAGGATPVRAPCEDGEQEEMEGRERRKTTNVLGSVKGAQERQAADHWRQDGLVGGGEMTGNVHPAVGGDDGGEQSRVLAAWAAGAGEKEQGKNSGTVRDDAAVPMGRKQATTCTSVQETQSSLQDRSAALLNRSYPTVLASILPLQSLAHTIARLILHLHRQLICRFIAAHTSLLLDTQKHAKTNLTPAMLQHLVRQLAEADAYCPPSYGNSGSSSSASSRGGKSTSNKSGGVSSCRSSNRGRGATCEENENGCFQGPAATRGGSPRETAEKRVGGSRGIDDLGKIAALFSDAYAAAAASSALADKKYGISPFAGCGNIGSSSTTIEEEQNAAIQRESRSPAVMRLGGGFRTAAAGHRISDQRVKAPPTSIYYDSPGGSSREDTRGFSATPAAADNLGCLVAGPAMYYASMHLRNSIAGVDDVSRNVSNNSGSRHYLYPSQSNSAVTPAAGAAAAAARTASPEELSLTATMEREERGNTNAFTAYADLVRAAAASVGASSSDTQARRGQTQMVSISRTKSGGVSTPPGAAVAPDPTFLPFASAGVSPGEKHVDSSLSACCPSADVPRMDAGLQLSTAEILERVVALSRQSSAESAASACCARPSPPEDNAGDKVPECNAAKLSQFLIRAQTFYASQSAGEKSAAAVRSALKETTGTQQPEGGCTDSHDGGGPPAALPFQS